MIARAVTVEVSLSIVVKLATILQTVLLARLYSPSELGTWGTAMLVMGAVVTTFSLGLDQFLLSRAHMSDAAKQLNVAFSLSLALGLSGMCAVILGAPLLDGWFEDASLVRHVRILSPMVLGAAFTLPMALWERQMKFGLPKIPTLAGILTLSAVASLTQIHWRMGVEGLILAQLSGFVVSTALFLCLSPLRPRLVWDSKEAVQQLTFGFPLFIGGIALFIASQGDDLLVRIFRNEEALGLYLVAFYLPSYATGLVGLISRVTVPALAQLRESRADLSTMFGSMSAYIAAIAVPLGLAIGLFAEELVLFLYGREWARIVPLVQVFSIAFVLRSSTGYHWQGLAIIFGRTRYVMWVALASAVFMIVIGTPLIWRYGLWGGAIYSLLQLGVMGPVVRFPLIMQTLGSLAYLRRSVPPLVAGCGASAFIIAMRVVGPDWDPLFFAVLFLSLYGILLHLLDNRLFSQIRHTIDSVRTR